jgi:hypothetical protein
MLFTAIKGYCTQDDMIHQGFIQSRGSARENSSDRASLAQAEERLVIGLAGNPYIQLYLCGAMAPKHGLRPPANFGRVVINGAKYRLQLSSMPELGARSTINGPSRDTEAEADEDCAQAQACVSRKDMLEFVRALPISRRISRRPRTAADQSSSSSSSNSSSSSSSSSRSSSSSSNSPLSLPLAQTDDLPADPPPQHAQVVGNGSSSSSQPYASESAGKNDRHKHRIKAGGPYHWNHAGDMDDWHVDAGTKTQTGYGTPRTLAPPPRCCCSFCDARISHTKAMTSSIC